MDLLSLDHSHPVVACILYLGLWAVISVAFLWPFSRESFLDRLPIVLTLVTELLDAAIEVLPAAVARPFEALLGHSIWAATTTKEANGMLLTMPWIERWQEGVGAIFIWVGILGALWAILNLCRRRAWVTNTIALGYMAVVWFFGHGYIM